MNAARPFAVVSLSFLVAACSGGGGLVPVIKPTSLAAQARATSLRLTWVDGSANETGFAIERALGDGEFRRIGGVASNVTRYEDQHLTPVTTYRYRVHARIAGGGDIASDVITVTTTTPGFTSVTPSTAFTIGGQRVTFRGDGFSAGVDAVHFNGVEATEVKIVDDSTLVCTTPPSVRPGSSSVSMYMPAGTTQQIDAFTYFTWPPVYQTLPDDIVADATTRPVDVQMVASGAAINLVWRQVGPQPGVFAARSRASGGWTKPIRLDGVRGLPWHLYAAVDGDNVYVVWVDFGSLYLAKSEDGGGRWSVPTRIPAQVGSVFHPKVVAQGQRVHVAWTDERIGKGGLYHNYSIDGGRTFRPLGWRVNTGIGAYDMQIATVGQDVYLLWWSAFGLGGIYFNRSTDGGVTWPDLDQLLNFLPGSLRASPPQLAAANGHIYVVSQEGNDRRIAIQRSSDRGVTWGAKQRLDRDDGISQMPRLAITPIGSEVYVVWHEGGGKSRIAGVEMNRSVDGGQTFLRWAARVTAISGSMGTTPVVCCNGKIVTVGFASNTTTGVSSVFVNSSAEWGLRWPRPDVRLSQHRGQQPSIHCHGGEMVISWVVYDESKKTYGLRAVRTLPR